MPFRKTAIPLSKLPRLIKQLIVFTVDVCICTLTVWIAFYLRLGEWFSLLGRPFLAIIVSLILALPLFVSFGLYRAIFRYSGLPALKTISVAVLIYGLLFSSVLTVISIQDIPRTIGLIQPLLLLLAIGGSRLFARYWLGGFHQEGLKRSSLPSVIIYGAGKAGRQLAEAMHNNPKMRIVGFLDDDDRLHGQVLNGLRIYNPEDLQDLVLTLKIKDVLLALPTINRKRRNEILNKIIEAEISVHTVPSLTELAQGKVTTTDLREVDIADLLGREPITPNQVLLGQSTTKKIVLVSGAGGSIGSELCRQIMSMAPSTLLLIDHSEFALYTLNEELLARKLDGKNTRIIPLLASVLDKELVRKIMTTWKPNTIYHAAAYKHVPLVEHNVVEGIKNNVLGTLTMAIVAEECGVKDFVLISTDKAVRPTSVMGASKRLSEMGLQALATKSTTTCFSMVRFGNVLGSSGSVVPKFRQLIKEGGPITLTHPEITRYFMTIPEAAQLVIQAGALAHGGDVFLLDMGEPVKIIDLAVRMIDLSGLKLRNKENPDGDIEIEITGLQPGEKLYEELLIGNNPKPTPHPSIMKAHEDYLPWPIFEEKLNTLTVALNQNDVFFIRNLLKELVQGYEPTSEIVDWVHTDQIRSE